MIRTARTIGPLIRALLFTAASATAIAAAAVGMVGCQDENAPETWVKKLGDPIQRPAAIKRLIQFFEDAMTRANKDRTDANVKALLDKIIDPLTKTYTDGDLDERTRIELIKFLADSRDPRAKAAWIKACSGFAEGKGASEDDVRWAAPAIGATKLEEGAQALGQAFVKLEAGTQKGSQAYKNVHDAMVQLASPSWKGIIVERLNRRIDKPAGAGDNAKVAAYQNELFWQTTSAELAGELRDPAAVKPLFKIVMTPSKADVAGTASVALIKIGKDAVPFLINALAGKDADLVDYAKANSGGSPDEAKSYVRAAAVVLGAIGRPDATGPMLQALESADSDVTRSIIARELTKLPPKPEVVKAFQAAYDKVSPTALMPPAGQNARSQLMEAAAHFYDAQMVPWVLKQIKDAKGGENEKNAVQISALVTGIKLMTKAQAPEVKAAVDKEGTPIEKDAFKLAADVVNGCGDNVGCYISKVQEPAAQEEKTQFTGIKAAYMLSILGNAGTSMEIVKQLPKVKNAAVRFSAVSAIDHLTQQQPAPVADALQKIVDENKAKDDRNMMQADAPVKEIVYRLRAR
jgi:HEAT repeat protein